MLRNFTRLVNEVIEEAHVSGINLFLESLELDLTRDHYIQENGLEETLKQILLNEETTTTENNGIEKIE